MQKKLSETEVVEVVEVATLYVLPIIKKYGITTPKMSTALVEAFGAGIRFSLEAIDDEE